MVNSLAVKKFEIKLIDAGKKLLLLPSSSSTSQLHNDLLEMEKLLYRVQILPSESMRNAMQPVIEAVIARELVRHPDMNVNISVARCIAEVLRIMAPGDPYNHIQMKDFFELAVITFEKLSSSSGGCYKKMMKVLKTFCEAKFSRLMCELQLDGLIVRLFKQFLTVADSNSPAVVHKMKKAMTTIIEKSLLLDLELVALLVASVREENRIASPVCWQLAGNVLMHCASQLKPHLPSKVSKEVYGYLGKSLPSTTATRKLRKSATKKRKLECIEGTKSMFQLVRRCQDVTKHAVKRLQVHSENEKKTVSLYDSSVTTKSGTEVKAQSVELGETLVGSRIKVWWPGDEIYHEGVVQSFDCIKKTPKVLYDDGYAETIYLERKQWELVENVSATTDSGQFLAKSDSTGFVKLGQELPRKVLSPQCGIICVQGYNVKQSVAPILESLLKRHGDIAAKCTIKSTSVRASFLEALCEIFRRIRTADVTTVISEMEEIKSQVSDAEVANIDVSWLHAHLEDREETIKKYAILMEMKVNIILVNRASRTDLKDRCVEFMAAQEWFEKAERCVKVLDLVEKKITTNIMQSKAEHDLWAIEPILQPLPRNVPSPPSGIICVRGYKVKQSVAPILEALFMKHGDIASKCVFKGTSVRASLLEIVCEVVKRIKSSDVTTIISKMKEIENQLSDAEAAKIDVSWLRDHLEVIHKGEEATKRSTMLMKTKENIIMVKKVARLNLKERYAEIMAARERFETAEKTMKVLDLVEKKLNNNILELKADKELWVEQPCL